MSHTWLTGREQRLFGQQLPNEVRERVQLAAATSNFNNPGAEKQLWDTQQMYPQYLAIYIVIYKYYLHQVRLAEAYQTLRQAMLAAAETGGFPADWATLSPHTTDWHSAKLPQHVYLYCLRELGIILQRMGKGREYYRILEKCLELDPNDNLGATGIRMLTDEMKRTE